MAGMERMAFYNSPRKYDQIITFTKKAIKSPETAKNAF
jgi:hypothetical protein